eukprot:1363651-Amorphochlora_amoeboformis.AAC.1
MVSKAIRVEEGAPLLGESTRPTGQVPVVDTRGERSEEENQGCWAITIVSILISLYVAFSCGGNDNNEQIHPLYAALPAPSLPHREGRVLTAIRGKVEGESWGKGDKGLPYELCNHRDPIS